MFESILHVIAEDADHEAHFPMGRGDSGVRDIARPLLQNFGAKFSETSFPLF